jgi:hypothetical protein
MTHSTLTVQTTPESLPSTPHWMGEVAAVAQVLKQPGILNAITERVRFARARMGTYDLIDFVVVLVGYALSAEPTLQAFYERLWPFADEFMTLFGRKRLPSRSALSRFLAALDQASVENMRTLFQQDLLACQPFADPGGITDRCAQSWLVTDVDGTRKVARQRALPQTEALPAAHRRFDHVCAKGYQGRKRGVVVRTRTVILQAHTHQFLGTFGGAGNGDYRGKLLRALQVLLDYAKRVACCMLVASAFVAVARFGSSVKSSPPPKNHAASVPSSGLCLLIRSLLLPHHPCLVHRLCLPLPLCFGVIGLVALCADAGPNSSAAKRPCSAGNLPLLWSLLVSKARSSSLVNSAPATGFPGPSAWLAIPVPLMLPASRSFYMACQLSSLRRSALSLRSSRKLFSCLWQPFRCAAGWASPLHRRLSMQCFCLLFFSC